MTPEDFTVLQGIGMVLVVAGSIILAGYCLDKLRNHFEWIRRIAP